MRRWLDGETGAPDRIDGPCNLPATWPAFLAALHRVDAANGPPAGPHSVFRGGPLTAYDIETRATIAALAGRLDAANVVREVLGDH